MVTLESSMRRRKKMIEKWLNDNFCKIGRKMFCVQCMNGNHNECYASSDHFTNEGEFECVCRCE